MFIIAIHHIQDPEAFWSIIKEKGGEIPKHLTLHGMYPSTNTAKSVCLWEAKSIDEVNSFLDQALGNTSRNELYEINEPIALGLPKVGQAQTQTA